MAFRAEKRTGAILSGLLLLAPVALAQQEFHYEALHAHSRVTNMMIPTRGLGRLTISSTGVSYRETKVNGETPPNPHTFQWNYEDIQQLQMAPQTLTVTTYKDNKWKLGADRSYRFDLMDGKTFVSAYRFLKGRLDQRFVAEIPDTLSTALWSVPVKRLLRFGGVEGAIQVGSSEIVYSAPGKGEARTWRYEDIDNISSSGPFQLTIVTYERSKSDYGSRKQFNFQLKRRLEENQYNDLWLRLNASHGLEILRSYRESWPNGSDRN
jgi:hypothetical protein